MSHMHPTRCKKLESFLVVFALSVMVVGVAAAEASGNGYDENTEIAVTGKVIRNLLEQHRGLHCFVLRSRSREYRVLTAPRWFLRRMGIRFPIGADITVVGSKFFGHDGSRCVVARTITLLPDGEKIVLRGSGLKPVWAHLRPGSSCMRIFYGTPR